MMSSEAVQKYIDEHNLGVTETKTEEQVAPVEQVKVEETPAPASNDDSKSVETKPSDPIENKPVDDEAKPAEESVVENKEDIKESEKKETYSQQEKVNYAFQKEKAKRKKLEARLRALEEENKALKGVNVADFKDDYSKLIDHSVSQKLNEAEIERVKAEYQSSQDAEFEEVNNQRISECFPDDIEQQRYRALTKERGPAFVKKLDADDAEGAVWSYLDDSDISPLLTRILMTNDKYYDEIMKYKSPYGKYMALDRLAQKVQLARAEMAKEKQSQVTSPKVEQNKPVEQVKPSMPVIGSVTKSESDSGPVVKDYNQILREMNQKRGYGR